MSSAFARWKLYSELLQPTDSNQPVGRILITGKVTPLPIPLAQTRLSPRPKHVANTHWPRMFSGTAAKRELYRGHGLSVLDYLNDCFKDVYHKPKLVV